MVESMGIFGKKLDWLSQLVKSGLKTASSDGLFVPPPWKQTLHDNDWHDISISRMKEKFQMLIYFVYPKKYQKFFCLQTIVALYVLRIQFFCYFFNFWHIICSL